MEKAGAKMGEERGSEEEKDRADLVVRWDCCVLMASRASPLAVQFDPTASLGTSRMPASLRERMDSALGLLHMSAGGEVLEPGLVAVSFEAPGLLPLVGCVLMLKLIWTILLTTWGPCGQVLTSRVHATSYAALT